jgi:hypothetical protein
VFGCREAAAKHKKIQAMCIPNVDDKRNTFKRNAFAKVFGIQRASQIKLNNASAAGPIKVDQSLVS